MEIKYNISQLGVICADLFGNAERCYKFLDEKKYIDKLKNMNQLGVIQHTFLKTSHTRMDYVILQVYLINFLLGRDFELNQSKNKKKKFNLGLSSTDEIGSFKVSGAELISIWILLFNSGHLVGTFAAEKGLLKFIKENNSIFIKFENNMPENLKPYFKICIQNNDTYNLHKFLIIFSLNVHYKQSKNQKNKKFIKFLINVCQFYFISQNDRHKKLKEYFNKIRQISYLFLDSQYSGLPINFKITSFLLNLDEYLFQILDESSYFNRALNSLDNLLAHNLYYSEESLSQFNYYSDKFNNYLKNNKLNENTIKNMIISGNFIDLGDYKENKNFHTFLELDTLTNSIYGNMFNINLENKLNNILPRSCNITIENNKRFNFIVINMIFSGKYHNHLNSISRLTKELIILKNKGIYKNEFIKIEENMNHMLANFMNKNFSNVFKDILLFILKNLIKTHYFIFEDSYDDVQIIAPHNKNNIDSVFESILEKNLDKYKKDEKRLIRYFTERLFYKNSTMLVSISSIKGYLKETDELNVEIDGLIFMYKNDKIHLFLIESKNKKKGAISTANKDLNIKLDKLGLENRLYDVESCFNPKGMYYHLII
jgi:hypothetical protein